MAKAEATAEELVNMVERGELRLPEMQRGFVWHGSKVRDLMDSLYRDYPSGGILIWETDADVPTRAFGVSQRKNPFQRVKLLLDGQQRITSLSALMRGEPVTVQDRKYPIDLLFNLNHPDENLVEEGDEEDASSEEIDFTMSELVKKVEAMTFVVASKKIEALPNWVRVSDIFKEDVEIGALLKKSGVPITDEKRYDIGYQRLNKVRSVKNYLYRMDVLESKLSYEKVTDIFVRVNSRGATLRSSDLALAQITAKWPKSLSGFLARQEECRKKGFGLDIGVHLRNMVVFATKQSKFRAVAGLDAETLKKNWDVSGKAMEFAMNFLKGNVGIEDCALLASPFVIPTIACYAASIGYKLSKNEVANLRKWTLVANAKGRYSRGSSETILDQDLAVIRDGGNATQLLERLAQQMGRLDVTAGDLSGKTMNSPLFKTMFLAFRAAGANDWCTPFPISWQHAGNENKMQYHHIFPKVQLQKKYARGEIDDIANLAFISAKSNQMIGGREPVDYMRSFLDDQNAVLFTAQDIPLDDQLLRVENYRDFVECRRGLIAQRLNQFMGTGRDAEE